MPQRTRMLPACRWCVAEGCLHRILERIPNLFVAMLPQGDGRGRLLTTLDIVAVILKTCAASDLQCLAAGGQRCPHARTPFFKSAIGEFGVDRQCLRRFRYSRGNQIAILVAFEAQGWPPRIYMPLGDHRNAKCAKQLKEAVSRLNQGQKPSRIRFHFRATDESVSWEFID